MFLFSMYNHFHFICFVISVKIINSKHSTCVQFMCLCPMICLCISSIPSLHYNCSIISFPYQCLNEIKWIFCRFFFFFFLRNFHAKTLCWPFTCCNWFNVVLSILFTTQNPKWIAYNLIMRIKQNAYIQMFHIAHALTLTYFYAVF